MKLKQLALAACLAVCAGGAFADDFVTSSPLIVSPTDPTEYSGSFGVTHLEAGNFTDIFNFTPTTLGGDVQSLLSTIGFSPTNNIDFISVFLNGVELVRSSAGSSEFAATSSLLSLTGPIKLIVNGFAGPGDGSSNLSASYSGTMNVSSAVSAVPEPETYAMMLAGIGFIGFVARRRKVKGGFAGNAAVAA